MIFPRKLFKWFVLPLLALVWLPFAVDEVVWQFKQTDAVGDFGVMWLAWIAVPTTVLCTALLLFIIGIRLTRGKLSRKAVMIVAAVAVIATSLWFVQHVRDRHEAAKREIGYQTVLAQYAAQLKPGMTREQVERHFRTSGKQFKQMCCVAIFGGEYVSFDRAGYDDLVKIAEESVPFVCNENNVYIAFEFNPKSQGELSNTNGSDILKRVSVFHQLEGCM